VVRLFVPGWPVRAKMFEADVSSVEQDLALLYLANPGVNEVLQTGRLFTDASGADVVSPNSLQCRTT
jgi:hypothetical protein